MGVVSDAMKWWNDQMSNWEYDRRINGAVGNATTVDELQYIRDETLARRGIDLADNEYYKLRMDALGGTGNGIGSKLAGFFGMGVDSLLDAYKDVSAVEHRAMKTALDEWIDAVRILNPEDPDSATDQLARIGTAGLNISMLLGGVQVLASNSPLGHAETATNLSKNIITQLGIAAVMAAIAHDPVKIGVLRPWQDALEQSFRNKRPDSNMIFQAYRTRELSPEKVDDVNKITDADMDRIESDNDEIFTREMSRHGYADWYIRALSYSATYTPRFNDMMQLARQGLLTRGMAIYSLWGSGYDKLTMRPMLDALMEQNRRGSYEGFRSMIEPSFRDGEISEDDLVQYWDRISVPQEVQGWVLPRLRKQRESTLAKRAQAEQQTERDLTMSQIQQAYQNLLLDRGPAQNMLLEMGYSMDAVKILLDLADLRRKAPSQDQYKRLTLTDYEKAYKNGLISQDEVLGRMRGEYAPRDIEIERMMLEKGIA